MRLTSELEACLKQLSVRHAKITESIYIRQCYSMIYINIFCLVWLLLWWLGYSLYVERQININQKNSISLIASKLRIDWVRLYMDREPRIADTALFRTLSQHVNFFASTTVFILAGIYTLMSKMDYSLFYQVDNGSIISKLYLLSTAQMKVLLLACIFTYAFFKFTWSIRQFRICLVLLGAGRNKDEDHLREPQRKEYQYYLSKLFDKAETSYNYGVRAYYFALSTLTWFLSPYLFIVSVMIVVAVLYHREFHSQTFNLLNKAFQSMQ